MQRLHGGSVREGALSVELSSQEGFAFTLVYTSVWSNLDPTLVYLGYDQRAQRRESNVKLACWVGRTSADGAVTQACVCASTANAELLQYRTDATQCAHGPCGRNFAEILTSQTIAYMCISWYIEGWQHPYMSLATTTINHGLATRPGLSSSGFFTAHMYGYNSTALCCTP